VAWSGRRVGYIKLREFNSLAKAKVQEAVAALEVSPGAIPSLYGAAASVCRIRPSGVDNYRL
jgi:hypothetical protein